LIQLIIIYLASIVDYIIGDPSKLLHPVQVIGWLIKYSSDFILQEINTKYLRKIAGIFLGVILIFSSGLITWLVIDIANKINIYLSLIFQVVLLASCFAGKSLTTAVQDVLQPLKTNNLDVARQRLSLYVGRDTNNLEEKEIYRAILETLAENTTDGVTAPLFYALLGSFFPIIGSVPMAIAYKSASTLDSMIGYKQEPYIDIGWFSAKFEDYLTWLPCRLTVLTISIINGNFLAKVLECKQYANQDPSPNSGWSEGIYAVVLGVQLGGKNSYRGEIKYKPLLGKPINSIDENIINQAILLTRSCFLLWLLIAGFLHLF